MSSIQAEAQRRRSLMRQRFPTVAVLVDRLRGIGAFPEVKYAREGTELVGDPEYWPRLLEAARGPESSELKAAFDDARAKLESLQGRRAKRGTI